MTHDPQVIARHSTPPAVAASDVCRQAVTELEEALRLPPKELGEEVDQAERTVVRLRDRLIGRLRQDAAAAEAPRWRAALDRVNAALSLIVGVEYPAAGLQRSSLEQARDTLKAVLAEGLP
jgi:predicted RNA-binding protein with PIN domain